MTAQVMSPFPLFFEADGTPLDGGFIYIGVAGLNPEANPQNIFSDEAQTVAIAQPVRTLQGYASVASAPVSIFCAADFSITVRDSDGVLVYSALSVEGKQLFGRDITISADAAISGDLALAGNLDVGGTATIAGAATFEDTATISGAAAFEDTADFVGAAAFAGATTFTDAVDLSGATVTLPATVTGGLDSFMALLKAASGVGQVVPIVNGLNSGLVVPGATGQDWFVFAIKVATPGAIQTIISGWRNGGQGLDGGTGGSQWIGFAVRTT